MIQGVQLSFWALPAFFCTTAACSLWAWMTLRGAAREAPLLQTLVALVSLWSAAHLVRALATELAVKSSAQLLLLPSALAITTFYALFALERAGALQRAHRALMPIALAPALILFLLLLLPATREAFYDGFSLRRTGDLVALSVDLTRLGSHTAALPFLVAAVGLAGFAMDAVRSPQRRFEALMFLALGLLVLPTHDLLRGMWTSGRTPFNLAPLGLGLCMAAVAALAWQTQDRLRARSTETIVNALPHALLIASSDGTILDANAVAERTLGPRTGSLRDRTIQEVLGIGLSDIGDAARELEVDGRHGRRRCALTHTVLSRSDGSVLMHALLLEDRTRHLDARKRLESLTDELLEQAADLEQGNAAKRAFVDGASVALSEPLRAILDDSAALGRRLAARPELEDANSFVQEIDQGAHHLHELVADIQTFEQSGREMQPALERVDLRALVESVASQLAPLTRAKAITFETHCPGSTFDVEADPQRLRQILINLASNAIKFTPDGGRVELRACAEGDEARLAVSDTGIGIGDGDLERIFTPFEQVDSSLSRRHGGTGLGLALVRRLAEMHGGRVSVASKEGSGSTFTVVLPRRHAAVAAPEHEETSA